MQPLPVAFQLLVFFNEIKGFVEVLGLIVADGGFMLGDDEIRCTAPFPLRFVGRIDFIGQRFDQGFQRRAVGMFGGVACGKGLFNLLQIFRN